MSNTFTAVLLVACNCWCWWMGYKTCRTSNEIAQLRADTAVKKAEIIVLKEEGKVLDELLTILKQKRGEI
jgi:hypothetical protein